MTSHTSKTSAQDLHRRVVDLLQEVNTLMNRASKELQSESEDGSKNKYQLYQQNINQEMNNLGLLYCNVKAYKIY